MDDWGGPAVARYVTPATYSGAHTQNVTVSATFTAPLFDPFETNGGASRWDWTDGQPDFAVFETTGEATGGSVGLGVGGAAGSGRYSGVDGGHSTLLASGFNTDILGLSSVAGDQSEVIGGHTYYAPAVGQTFTTTNGGLSIAPANTSMGGGTNFGNNGNYGGVNTGAAGVSSASATWALTNIGTIYSTYDQ